MRWNISNAQQSSVGYHESKYATLQKDYQEKCFLNMQKDMTQDQLIGLCRLPNCHNRDKSASPTYRRCSQLCPQIRRAVIWFQHHKAPTQ
ncbi:hypothetical protein TNIN_444801 [Trichonephila inaurata madagascariensis]|uniref:Uncharacterized protein n=1 Tax=Trichonephila inaurata madagascariensis TaxID=2747483 RepID=A0A8X6YWH3_9ARAC|nr:hypothetical protein TNIN_444801 [Trichonephila inaurata madagascariensis]